MLGKGPGSRLANPIREMARNFVDDMAVLWPWHSPEVSGTWSFCTFRLIHVFEWTGFSGHRRGVPLPPHSWGTGTVFDRPPESQFLIAQLQVVYDYIVILRVDLFAKRFILGPFDYY